jgi:hypothetical protein
MQDRTTIVPINTSERPRDVPFWGRDFVIFVGSRVDVEDDSDTVVTTFVRVRTAVEGEMVIVVAESVVGGPAPPSTRLEGQLDAGTAARLPSYEKFWLNHVATVRIDSYYSPLQSTHTCHLGIRSVRDRSRR